MRSGVVGTTVLAALSVAATATATATVTTAAVPVQAAPAQVSTLAWGPCEEDVDPAFDCATLTVPLDYANPAGGAIPIALIRLPATGARAGAVLFNPGGPGGSGYDFMSNAGQAIATQMAGLSSFDLIGFDPRGVDRSNGLRCLDDPIVDAQAYADDTPDSPAAELASDVGSWLFGAACQARYGQSLAHYSTANTARDMDSIRIALGDAQISYLGISYGTYLGGVYATMFPNQVRAMVLDSAYDPTGDTIEQQYLTQLPGFEHAFDNWAAWCEETSECEFTAVDVAARWDALLAQLDATPIKSRDGRVVNQVAMETATISTLYSEQVWPALGAALADAEQGDGTGLLRLADSYSGRHDDGTWDTSQQSGTVIRCASGIQQATPPDPAALLAQIQAAAPRFSRGITVDGLRDTCSDLFSPPATAVTPSYQGTAPILVIGGLNDPATPFRWAEELTAELGPSARLVTYTGEGHGQILNSTCVTALEAATISQLSLPQPGTTCDPDPEVPRPAFWDSLPVPAGVGPAIDDPMIGVVLGLSPTQMYSTSWLLSGDAAAVATAYTSALSGQGYFVAPPNYDQIEGATLLPAMASDGTELVILIMPSAAITGNPDFADLVDVVPAGQGLVVVAAFAAS